MRGSLVAGVLLIGALSMSSAAEVHIDEHTLCPVALRAFDETTCRRLRNFFGLSRASSMSLMPGRRIRKKLQLQQNSPARALKCLLY